MWIWVPDNTSSDTIRSLGGFAFTNPQVIAEFDRRFGSFVQQQQQQQQQNQQTQYPQHPDYTVANRSVQQPQMRQQYYQIPQNGGIGPNTVIAGQQGQPIAQVQTAQAGWNPNNAQVQYEWMYSPAQGGFTGVRTYNLNDNPQQQVQLPSQEMDNSRVRRGVDVTGQPLASSAQTPTSTTTSTTTSTNNSYTYPSYDEGDAITLEDGSEVKMVNGKWIDVTPRTTAEIYNPEYDNNVYAPSVNTTTPATTPATISATTPATTETDVITRIFGSSEGVDTDRFNNWFNKLNSDQQSRVLNGALTEQDKKSFLTVGERIRRSFPSLYRSATPQNNDTSGILNLPNEILWRLSGGK